MAFKGKVWTNGEEDKGWERVSFPCLTKKQGSIISLSRKKKMSPALVGKTTSMHFFSFIFLIDTYCTLINGRPAFSNLWHQFSLSPNYICFPLSAWKITLSTCLPLWIEERKARLINKAIFLIFKLNILKTNEKWSVFKIWNFWVF